MDELFPVLLRPLQSLLSDVVRCTERSLLTADTLDSLIFRVEQLSGHILRVSDLLENDKATLLPYKFTSLFKHL
eukprot:m.6842 g.6842  ORF g.6842 m.6842 type:complete len:74 (+) comp17011_c0_seq1:63-284(+)